MGELLGYPNEKNPAQHAYRLRAAGELFGVWSPKGRYVHPDFQFENGSIRPRVRELLEALPQRSDDGGWGNSSGSTRLIPCSTTRSRRSRRD